MSQFKMPTQLQIISAGLAEAASDALRNLLENHHLYQSVTPDIAAIDKMIERIKQKPTSPISPMSGDDVAAIKRLSDFRNGPWAFSLEGVLPAILVPPLRKETPIPNWFQPSTVCVTCSNCDGVKPPHNPGYLGLTSDSIYAFTAKQNSIKSIGG